MHHKIIKSLASLFFGASLAAGAEMEPQPPISISFELAEPKFVTIVIDDESGVRVRNLVSETRFEAGKHTVGWDGLDGPESRNVRQGSPQLVKPGTYQAKILTRDSLDLRYEMAVYNPGDPPWDARDPKGRNYGGWLADWSAPGDVLFLPEGSRYSSEPHLAVCAVMAEWGNGLMWIHPDGRKIDGKRWVGGHWTGAECMARDVGPNREDDIDFYTACGWSGGKGELKGELRLTKQFRKNPKLERRFIEYFVPDIARARVGGLAVHNGLLVVTLPEMNEILFVDVKTEKLLGKLSVESPRGLRFNKDGTLLCSLQTSVVRYTLPNPLDDPAQLPAPKTVITGLENARRFTIGPDNNLYIADRGKSNQIKVFDSSGKLVRAIGKASEGWQVGPYDEQQLGWPNGCEIDNQGQLWVPEQTDWPKRLSVWSLDGKLLRACYGPPSYGGGGQIDSLDRTIAYYSTKGKGIQFKIDWDAAAWKVSHVHGDQWHFKLQLPGEAPQLPLYVNGRKYMTNVYNSNPTNGVSAAGIWKVREDGLAVPVAVVGAAFEWDVLHADELASLIPKGLEIKNRYKGRRLFTWSDLNLDHKIDADELKFHPSIDAGQWLIDEQMRLTDGNGVQLAPQGFTDKGVPIFDATKITRLMAIPPKRNESGSGGGTLIASPDGWLVCNDGPVKGYRGDKLVWSYANDWPSLHSSHNSPKPRFPGDMIGGTRIIGLPVMPKTGEAGHVWFLNGNMGCIYAMTTDGFFLGTLFKDERLAPGRWPVPAKRGMLLNNSSNNQESFWPSVTQTPDGKVYLAAGGSYLGVVAVEGLDSIRRLPAQKVEVTKDSLLQSEKYLVAAAAKSAESAKREPLAVLITDKPMAADGNIDDWAGSKWVTIEKGIAASARIDGQHLYVAWKLRKSGDGPRLANSGESTEMLFKTGSALDLMLQTDPSADPKRQQPVAGDIRIVATSAREGNNSKERTRATLYRAVVPGATRPVPFSSPWRTVNIDQVLEVSDRVQLVTGIYKEPVPRETWTLDHIFHELAIPLDLIGLKPAAGMTLKADLGYLRGERGQTLERLYWSNKSAGLTADVPAEAALTPQLWGVWKIDK